jgi:hypothetical protein
LESCLIPHTTFHSINTTSIRFLFLIAHSKENISTSTSCTSLWQFIKKERSRHIYLRQSSVVHSSKNNERVLFYIAFTNRPRAHYSFQQNQIGALYCRASCGTAAAAATFTTKSNSLLCWSQRQMGKKQEFLNAPSCSCLSILYSIPQKALFCLCLSLSLCHTATEVSYIIPLKQNSKPE